jgi:hypothetical protein
MPCKECCRVACLQVHAPVPCVHQWLVASWVITCIHLKTAFAKGILTPVVQPCNNMPPTNNQYWVASVI